MGLDLEQHAAYDCSFPRTRLAQNHKILVTYAFREGQPIILYHAWGLFLYTPCSVRT
jgi:hypothetical protein